MKKSCFPLIMFTALAWLLCAIDGVCVVLKVSFLGTVGGWCMTAFFFAFLGGLLWFGWKAKNLKLLKALIVWACVALGSMLGVILGLWGLVALGAGSPVIKVSGVLVGILSAPVSSCSVMFLPVFGWACVLVVGIKLYRSQRA